MNKKFIISAVVIFALTVVLGFIVHGVVLHDDYAQLANLVRPQQEMGRYYGYLLFGQALFSVAFVWVYLKGKENKPFLAQGIRYGIVIAILTTVSAYLIYYAVYPVPGALVVKQIVLDSISVIIFGIAVAWLNK